MQVAADLLAALSRLPSKIFDLDSLLYFYFHSVDDKEKKELLQREVTRLICFSIFIVEVAKKNTESPYLNEITLELFVNKSLDWRGRIYYSYIADVQTSPVFRILATTGSAPVGPYKALYKAAALKLLVDGKQILGSVNEVAKHFKPSSAPVPSKVLRSKLLKDFRYFLFYQVYYYTSLLPDEELTAAGLEFDHTSSGPQLIGIVTKDVLLSVGTNAWCYSKENEKSFEDTWFRDFYADALAFWQKEDPKLHARFKQCGIDITRSWMKSFIMVYTYAKEEFSLQTQEVRDDLLLSNTQAWYKYWLISFKSRVPDSPLFKLLDLENPTITNLNLLNAEETKQYTTDCMTEPVLIFRSLINSLNKHYPSLTNFLRSVRELVVSDKTEFVRFPLCIFDATDKEPVTVQVRYLQKESHRVWANFSMHSRMPSVTVDVPLVKPTSPEEILEKSETILLDATSSSPTKSAPARRIRMSASLSYKQLPEKINIRVTKRSLAANWVHAWDASLLFRVLQELSLAKCYPAHIHDCYIIHPKDLILLLNTIRKQAALCSDLARSNLYAALLDHQQWVHENLRFYSAKMNEYSSEVLAPKSLQNALASAKEAVKLFDKHAVPLLKQMELVDVIDYTPGFYVNL